jgi:hypothetical protein
MSRWKIVGLVSLLGAACACGGAIKEQLSDTPQQQIERLKADLQACLDQNRSLGGDHPGGQVTPPPPGTPSVEEQLRDTPQRQIEGLKVDLGACQDENQRLMGERAPGESTPPSP